MSDENELKLGEEEWRSAVGYEALYEVSDKGRVRRHVDSARRMGKIHGRLLKGYVNDRGYCKTTLTKGRDGKSYSIHRLVMLAFVGPCPDGLQVNHRSGIKDDNRLVNLEYVTPKANTQHAFDTGLRQNFGEKSKLSKLTDVGVMDILNQLEKGVSIRDVSNIYGVNHTTILRIKRNERWKHVPRLSKGNSHAAC